MKHLRLFLTTLAVGLVLPACKSHNPEFGIPDEPKAKPLGRILNDDRSWAEKRHDWKVREREKSRQMFNRMKDDY